MRPFVPGKGRHEHVGLAVQAGEHDHHEIVRVVALPQDPEQMTGPQLYDAYCATCHQARGQGSFDGGLPPLFHNTALGRHDAHCSQSPPF
jgi:mono/diheme cytochrome c family protein